MENKQLNFNQPLLSVKRFSSTAASEKDDKRKTNKFVPKIPRLPSYKSDLKSGPVGNPGTVPFLWEQSPGRPKGESKPRTPPIERPPVAPKLPPGLISKAKIQDSDVPSVTKYPEKVHKGSQSVPSLYKNSTKLESSKATIKEEKADSRDGDEEYQDALDSLSRTESFFLNCSVSGISGLDGPDVKPFGTFATDPQTRDFMMGRFLPAAKAMASETPSETPQYAPRKQPVVWDQPREMKKKVVGGDKQPPLRYSNIASHYAQENVEEESDDEYDENERLSAKVCGFLPRFCLKNSLCLLNPVPGMSVRTRVPMSPASRTQTSSSSGGSCSEMDNEHARVSPFQKHSARESNQITLQSSNNLEGSALYRRLQGSEMSENHSDSLQLPFSEQKGFTSIQRDVKSAGVNGFISHTEGPRSFKELLADGSKDGEVNSGSPMVEKTLYIDILHKVESPKRNSLSPDTKGLSRENDCKVLARSNEMEEFKDIENLSIADEEVELQPNIQKSNQGVRVDRVKGHHGPDQDSYQDFKSKLPGNNNQDFEARQPPKAENLENFHRGRIELPAPPPLPKSPSDSWLGRTLPSISSKNSSMRSYLGTGVNPRNHASRTPSNDPKTGAILKTTKGQQQHSRFLQEPLPSIREA